MAELFFACELGQDFLLGEIRTEITGEVTIFWLSFFGQIGAFLFRKLESTCSLYVIIRINLFEEQNCGLAPWTCAIFNDVKPVAHRFNNCIVKQSPLSFFCNFVLQCFYVSFLSLVIDIKISEFHNHSPKKAQVMCCLKADHPFKRVSRRYLWLIVTVVKIFDVEKFRDRNQRLHDLRG